MSSITLTNNNINFDITWVTANAVLNSSGLIYTEEFTLVLELQSGRYKLVEGRHEYKEALKGHALGYGSEFECNALIRILVSNSMKILEPKSKVHSEELLSELDTFWEQIEPNNKPTEALRKKIKSNLEKIARDKAINKLFQPIKKDEDN